MLQNVRSWSTTQTPRVNESGRSYNEKSRTETITRSALVEPADLQKLDDNQAIVIYQGRPAKMMMPRHYEDTPANEYEEYVSPSTLAAFLESAEIAED